MLDFSGKVAFVTGAGSVGEGWGNGKATAVLLARQGATVYGIDVSEGALSGAGAAMEAEGLGSRWTGRVCDATRSEDVAAAVADCVGTLRAHRHSRQQRRRQRARRSGQHVRGAVAAAARPESQDRLPRLQARASGDGAPVRNRGPRRRHRQPVEHRLHDLPGRGPGERGLCGVEGRRSWPSAAPPPSPTSARASA